MEQISTQLAARLNTGEFETEMYCLSAGGPFAERLKNQGVPVTIFDYRTYLLPGNIASLARHIKRGNFQIVHTHTYSAGMLGRIAAFFAGVPVIIHHTHTTGMENLGWRQRLFERLVTRFLTDKVIAVSNATKRLLISLGFGTESKISVIYNGVETSFCKPSGRRGSMMELHKLSGKKVLVTAASLTPHKGHRFLLEALKDIRKEYPSACCVFVGGGLERRALDQQAKVLGLSDCVIFTGIQEDIRPYLECADLFVLPSLRESMGIAIVEAMAKKLPVVASNIDGIPEVIEDGLTGLLAQTASSEDIALKITTMFSNPEKSRQMGEEGYKRFIKCFTLDQSVNAVRELYYSCLKKKRLSFPQSISGNPEQ
jgi:glycosyltransferase involved in cell wall biosynthesis